MKVSLSSNQNDRTKLTQPTGQATEEQQSLQPVNNSLKGGIISTACVPVTPLSHTITYLSEASDDVHGRNCSLHTPVRFCCRSISQTTAELAQCGDMISLLNISEAFALKSC